MFVFGVDVSKRKLDVVWLRDAVSLRKRRKTFDNAPEAAEALMTWARQVAGCGPDQMQVILEPTSMYHETLALGLHRAGAWVSVVNPNKIRKYAEGIGMVHKTDAIDSLVLARYGVQAKPPRWQPEPEEIRHLKDLLHRLHTLEQDIQREQNRMEKAHASALLDVVTASIEQTLSFLQAEKKRIEQSIDDHIDQHPHLKQDRQLLQSIPGIGPTVSSYMVALLRAHTFDNANQAAAFIGLIPVLKQSGSSIKKRPRLSKQGSSVYRAKLYLPAIVSKQYNPDVKALYERLLLRGKSKMAAIGAAMRKLVVICYGVLKHQTPYQPRVQSY